MTKEEVLIKELRNLIRNTGRSNILFKNQIQEILNKYDKEEDDKQE
jgi:hypothetical protein